MIRPYSEPEGITARIIRCAIEVHRVLGPGLLESVYQECLLAEMKGHSLSVRNEVRFPVSYKGIVLAAYLVIDLLVEEQVVVELKAVEHLTSVHQAQVVTYLKLTRCPVGLLINFNEVLLKTGIRRLDRPDLYAKRRSQGTNH